MTAKKRETIMTATLTTLKIDHATISDEFQSFRELLSCAIYEKDPVALDWLQCNVMCIKHLATEENAQPLIPG